LQWNARLNCLLESRMVDGDGICTQNQRGSGVSAGAIGDQCRLHAGFLVAHLNFGTRDSGAARVSHDTGDEAAIGALGQSRPAARKSCENYAKPHNKAGLHDSPPCTFSPPTSKRLPSGRITYAPLSWTVKLNLIFFY